MIEFRNVTKAFGDKIVLDQINFKIPAGKISFIIGKSGEGKTVILKLIMGLLKPNSGRIVVDGEDITDFDEDALNIYRRKFGVLFQGAALFDGMTVGENVRFPLQEHSKLSPHEMDERVGEALAQVGLPNFQSRNSTELTTADKKRAGLARAIAGRPKIIIYDEPTTGMDPIVCEVIDSLIAQISNDELGVTSVVISHDLKAAEAIAEEILFLYNGKIQLCGTPSEFHASKDPFVRQFFAGKVDGPMTFK